MTKEEILAMKPGRELDALVAVKVMGWTIATMNGSETYVAMGDIPKPWANEWMPSSDISAAWEVVEKLGKYCFAEIRRLHRATGIGEAGEWRWHAGLCREDSGQCHWATAETAPEAICKAALLACLEGK